MSGDESGSGTAPEERVFMALPGNAEDRRAVFEARLMDVVRGLGLQVGPASEGGEGWTWVHRARTALRTACRRGLTLSEESFDVLLEAAVHDPDPSFNRQFVEPALNAFGYTRVRGALLRYLTTGTDHERAGAARAWYWTALRLRMPQVRAEHPGGDGADRPGDRSALVAEWHEAALRAFVSSEDVHVQRCILPILPLRRSAHPDHLHALVDRAVALARAHPDAYIRHRVELQAGD